MSNENLNAIWSKIEFEKLVELVKPHPVLYSDEDVSTRKNILARESTWELIAKEMGRPVEDCKKRWKALRDGYMKTLDNPMKPRVGLIKNLSFLSEETVDEQAIETKEEMDQQVITDNQEYYEITLVEPPQENKTITCMPKMIIPQLKTGEPPAKMGRKNCGRKKNAPVPINLQPIKILPKPVNVLNGANIVRLLEEKTPPPPQVKEPSRSEVIDSLIEKVLSEHTNSIDVFFRSMAASVKKLPPSLIPKVKMEVCNVIAKYEMQSFDKSASS